MRIDRKYSRPPWETPRSRGFFNLSIFSAGFIGVLVVTLLAVSLYFAPEGTAIVLAVIGIGLPLFVLAWSKPEYGLLAIIFLTSSFIPADVIDLRLPIGGGLDLRDLVLTGMLGLCFVKGLVGKQLAIPWWPVGGLLLLFLGFAILSGVNALFFQKVEVNWALGELRILLFYSVFLIAAWSIFEKYQLIKVLAGLFLIADFVAVLIILQQFLGAAQPLLTAMLGSHWHLWQQNIPGGSFGTLRIVPPGHVLMYFMMILAFCLMFFTKKNGRLRVFLALQFIFLNFGLFLTYTRAQWMAAAVAIGFIVLTISPKYKDKLPKIFLIGIAVSFIALFFIFYNGAALLESINNLPIINVIVNRTNDETLQWRLFEMEESLQSISEHPFLGVGLGNSYRDLTILAGEARGWWSGGLEAGELSRYTRYIHNSYLAIAVKMGLPAFFSFLLLCMTFLVCGWKIYSILDDRHLKGLVLSIIAGFLGLLAWAILHSHFVETESTSVVGLMIGLVAAVHNIQKRLQKPPQIQEQPFNKALTPRHSNE